MFYGGRPFVSGGITIQAMLFVLIWAVGPATARPVSLDVAVSLPPLADLTRMVAGDRARVITILPPGASPHTFAPTPRLLARLARARVLIVVGAGLDDWAMRMVDPRRTRVVVLTRGLNLLQGDPEHASGGNPHIWLDPILMIRAVNRIAAVLIAADPSGRRVFQKGRAEAVSRLRALDRWVKSRRKTWRHWRYVAFHPFLAYFARRYSLIRVGVIEAAPGKQPTPRHLMKLVRAIGKYRVRFVLAEPQLNDQAARVIAREAGVKVIKIDPLGGTGPAAPGSYFDVMRRLVLRLESGLR